MPVTNNFFTRTLFFQKLMETSSEYAKAAKASSEVELTKFRQEKEIEKEKLAQQKVREAREADLQR